MCNIDGKLISVSKAIYKSEQTYAVYTTGMEIKYTTVTHEMMAKPENSEYLAIIPGSPVYKSIITSSKASVYIPVVADTPKYTPIITHSAKLPHYTIKPDQPVTKSLEPPVVYGNPYKECPVAERVTVTKTEQQHSTVTKTEKIYYTVTVGVEETPPYKSGEQTSRETSDYIPWTVKAETTSTSKSYTTGTATSEIRSYTAHTESSQTTAKTDSYAPINMTHESSVRESYTPPAIIHRTASSHATTVSTATTATYTLPVMSHDSSTTESSSYTPPTMSHEPSSTTETLSYTPPATSHEISTINLSSTGTSSSSSSITSATNIPHETPPKNEKSVEMQHESSTAETSSSSTTSPTKMPHETTIPEPPMQEKPFEYSPPMHEKPTTVQQEKAMPYTLSVYSPSTSTSTSNPASLAEKAYETEKKPASMHEDTPTH
jgi:hypothetical protein